MVGRVTEPATANPEIASNPPTVNAFPKFVAVQSLKLGYRCQATQMTPVAICTIRRSTMGTSVASIAPPLRLGVRTRGVSYASSTRATPKETRRGGMRQVRWTRPLLRHPKEALGPDVLGGQDGETGDDDDDARPREDQHRDADEDDGATGDGDRDPLSAALDEEADRLDRREGGVVMPAAVGVWERGLDLLDDRGCVDFFGVVAPDLSLSATA
jgi:hypothetical protein